jgi:probable HAF family extracellular repeat protein
MRVRWRWIVRPGWIAAACLLAPLPPTASAAAGLHFSPLSIGSVFSRCGVFCSMEARDVNAGGEFVGGAERLTRRHDRDVIWSWDAARGLRNLGQGLYGLGAEGYGVNDTGDIAGTMQTPTSIQHAFLMTAAGTRDLGTLGGDTSQGLAVNNHDQVAGRSDLADGSLHAFLWTPGTGMRDLGTLGGFGSIAFDVNNAGEVVGFADPPSNQSRAFRWQNGHMTMLAGVGGHQSAALAVNDAGEVVGEVHTRSHETHAAIWPASGGVIDVGARLTPGFSQALDVNDNGDVLVATTFTDYLYRDGRFINLDKAIVPDDGGGSVMNDNLQMAGGECEAICNYDVREPVTPFDDANPRIAYHGHWAHARVGDFYAGSTTWSDTAGASATLQFTGRRVWWAAPRGPARGSATVYIDGAKAAVVHLHADRRTPRDAVYEHSFPEIGSHTIRVVVDGAPRAHPRVDIDAFTVSQL